MNMSPSQALLTSEKKSCVFAVKEPTSYVQPVSDIITSIFIKHKNVYSKKLERPEI